MQPAENLRTQIAATLASLRYPIRSREELASELDRFHIRCFCDGTSCLGVGEALRLLHPRDFLFTNAQQIADLVAVRAAVPQVHNKPICGTIH